LDRDNRKRRFRKEKEAESAFFFDGAPDDVRREKERGRDLKASEWWKRKLAEGRCHWCGGQFPAAELTMDHVVPLSRGGRSVKGNVVPACEPCNKGKDSSLPMEWKVGEELP